MRRLVARAVDGVAHPNRTTMPSFTSPTAATVPEPEPTIDVRGRPLSRTDELDHPVDLPTSVSVIIPTYNEADTIRSVVTRCRVALRNYPSEVIVVDDDSPDGTWRLVEEAYRGTGTVRVVRRTDDQGLATAVTRGFREADGEVCVVMDADLQHSPGKVPDLVEAFDDGIDLVIGSRYTPGGDIENWSRTRQLVSRGATHMARVWLPDARRIDDPLSGFFAVRRDVLRTDLLSPLGYKILLELLVKCDHERVVEIPYTFTERTHGESNLTFDEYLNFVRHLLRLRRGEA